MVDFVLLMSVKVDLATVTLLQFVETLYSQVWNVIGFEIFSLLNIKHLLYSFIIK